MNCNNQVSIFGNLIKENVWSLKLVNTKGNREKYIESIDSEIDDRLICLPDRRKAERFKKRFYGSIFATNMHRGIYNEMTISEIYDYEYVESRMNSPYIYVFDNFFYEGSYIHLNDYHGTFELMIDKIKGEVIEVTHRFGSDKYYRRFSSVEELKQAMWTLDDIKALDDDLEGKTDNDLWSVYSMLFQAHLNYDWEDKQPIEYINDFRDRCWKEIRKREYEKAAQLSETEILKLIAEYIYNHCWDDVRESIDSDTKEKAIKKIAKNKADSGQTFSHKRFSIGFLNCSTKGVDFETRDKRNFKFSWSKIYDVMQEDKKPKQIDIFAILSLTA